MRRIRTVGSCMLAITITTVQRAAAAPTRITANTSIPGTAALAKLAGGMMTIGLIGAAIGLMISLGGIAVAGHSHNVHLRDRFKTGAFLSLLGTAAFGGANRLLDWAWSVGLGF